MQTETRPVTRRRRTSAEIVDDLKKKRDRLDQRIQRAQNREKLAEKKIADNRKFTVGRCILESAESDPAVMEWMGSELDAFLKRKNHRMACAPYLPVQSWPSDYDPATAEPEPGSRTARKLRFLRESLIGNCVIELAKSDPHVREWLSWRLHGFFATSTNFHECDRRDCQVFLLPGPGIPGAFPSPTPAIRFPQPSPEPAQEALPWPDHGTTGVSLVTRLRRRIGI